MTYHRSARLARTASLGRSYCEVISITLDPSRSKSRYLSRWKKNHRISLVISNAVVAALKPEAGAALRDVLADRRVQDLPRWS